MSEPKAKPTRWRVVGPHPDRKGKTREFSSGKLVNLADMKDGQDYPISHRVCKDLGYVVGVDPKVPDLEKNQHLEYS